MSRDHTGDVIHVFSAQKLQELIRRGTPRDLALAQDLMKILAGAEPEKKPNYREQVGIVPIFSSQYLSKLLRTLRS
jgi:hypothetical protein